jgi:PAS domain S-box-containing protein
LKSPIGILFYDKEGRLIAANQSAKKIAGIPESEYISLNLFNDPNIALKKQRLIDERVIKFQFKMDFENIRKTGYYNPTRSGTAYLDFAISVVDSGYLVQIQDITERKKIEEILTENEKKYRELVENANSIIIKMDKKGRITFFNEFAEKFFGFNKEKIMGKNVIGTMVPETESSGRNLQKVINGIIKDPEAHINMENENVTCDGKKVWVAWTNKGIYDDNGEVTGVLSIGTDISKRKHAEVELQKAHNNMELKVRKRTSELNESNDALRKEIQERKYVEEALIKSRNYLDKIINSIADPVFVKDKQHRWVLLNDAYCKLMGYSREEILGKSDYNFFSSREADVFWEKDEEVFKTGAENVNEEEFTDSNGNLHVLVTKKTLYVDISGEKCIVASIRDITERKKAENELRRSERKLKIAMDMAKLVPWEYDVSSNLYTFDDQFYKLYCTTSDKEGGSKMSPEEYARKFIPPDESSIVKDKIAEALETDDPDFSGKVEHSIIRADGKKRFILVRSEIIKDDKGRTIKIYGVNQDITERKKAEEKLEEIIEELERSNYELQQFAYITSHDLQEPLRTIASFTQLLERRYGGQLDSDADEFIEFIVDAAVRMKEMIQGLLEYSRVGTQKVEFKEVDMNMELDQALSNLNALINKNKAEIAHDSLPKVMADSDQMVRVFQNLVGNAIKFRKPDETPKIHISCQIDKKNSEYIFEVSDNGIGIEKEYKDKIFEVFKRLHAMGKYEGTGIGLSVVKKIIEQYNGRIWVESEWGNGSTFYFTLPINII